MDNLGVPDLSGMIGNMLSDPETLKNILNVASGLKNAGIFSPKEDVLQQREEETAPSYREAPPAYTVKNGTNDAGESGEPRTKQSFSSDAPLYALPNLLPPKADRKGVSGAKDQRRELLLALRPYMSKDRREKIDGILQIFSFLELAEGFGGLFGKDGKGEGGT